MTTFTPNPTARFFTKLATFIQQFFSGSATYSPVTETVQRAELARPLILPLGEPRMRANWQFGDDGLRRTSQ